MQAREGTTATIVGIIVVVIGYALYGASPVWGAGIIGFGLGHVVLGLIDLFQNNYSRTQG